MQALALLHPIATCLVSNFSQAQITERVPTLKLASRRPSRAMAMRTGLMMHRMLAHSHMQKQALGSDIFPFAAPRHAERRPRKTEPTFFDIAATVHADRTCA